MKNIHASIEKNTEQLRKEGYTSEEIDYFWHNAVNAFKKRVASEKNRCTKNLTGKSFEQRKRFTIEADDGKTITGRWAGEPKSKKLDKQTFLNHLEDRVVWWEE